MQIRSLDGSILPAKMVDHEDIITEASYFLENHASLAPFSRYPKIYCLKGHRSLTYFYK